MEQEKKYEIRGREEWGSAGRVAIAGHVHGWTFVIIRRRELLQDLLHL